MAILHNANLDMEVRVIGIAYWKVQLRRTQDTLQALKETDEKLYSTMKSIISEKEDMLKVLDL